MTKYMRVVAATAVMISGVMNAFAPSNEFRPYDAAFSLLKPRKSDTFRLSIDGEYGSRRTGKNWDAKRKNILALHDDTQSTIGMVQNPVNGNAALLAAISQIDSTVKDDGTRGNVLCAGKYSGMNINLSGNYGVNASVNTLLLFAPLINLIIKM